MKTKLSLLFIGLTAPLFAQFQITIDARVLDEETREPIPYANVEFVNTAVSEVTTAEGEFTMKYDEELIGNRDLFVVSAFGYETQDIYARDFYKFLTNTNTILLRQKKGINPNDNADNSEVPSTSIPKGALSGKVLVKSVPVQGARIAVKDSFREAVSGPDGEFSLDAEIGDVIVVKFLGMVTKEIEVKDLASKEITLESDGELLEEVFLNSIKFEEPKVDLGYNGKKTFDEITYSAGIISQDEVKSSYYQLSDLLNGRLSKLTYSRNGSITLPSSFVYDIDGMVYSSEQETQLPWIDPQIIESITVLNSLSATHKYGTLARNGVIVIRTKNIGTDKPLPEKPSPLVKGNGYNESVRMIETNMASKLWAKLNESQSFEAARTILEDEIAGLDMPGVAFYFNASDYFQRWDKDFTLELLAEVGKLGYNNTKALRALAFKYEEIGEYEKAKEVFQRVAVLSPGEAQTYIDLARGYKNTGQYQESLDLLKMMMANKKAGIDFSGLRNSIENEIQHMLAFHRSKVDYYDLPNDLRTANFKRDVRVLCEWNDPYAEFEIQFVNPGKRFFTWNNTKLQNTRRMLDGIKNGYSLEEFIIDDAESGEWIINLKTNKADAGINPTYFKYTVFTNYGLSNETRETRVIQLSEHSEKVTIDRLKYQ